MNELAAKIEAVLFLSTRPVSYSKLAKLLGIKEEDVHGHVNQLAEVRNSLDSGIRVVVGEAAVELASNPDFTDVTSKMSKEEMEGELTRPQLETLTIIAYRGPITRPEIEHVRGVNCSIILRNLLMRGLVVEKEDVDRLQMTYSLSTEMMRHLGISSAVDLPDYEQFNGNEKITEMLSTVFDSPEE
ncbi:MAG: SMC-Scp complex subunit ScpB [Candidatus Uhrbacteria bacterium]|nr:SMC-Scp complex subunit ScpB [Candidatus Uhrbacteria bacterium]